MTPEKKNNRLMTVPSRPVHQHAALGPIRAWDRIEDHLSAPRFHCIEASVAQAREHFYVNSTVISKEQVIAELYQYHVHLTNWFSPIVGGEPGKAGTIRSAPDVALTDWRRWYRRDLDEAVRDALFVRSGGLIGVIDAITEGLLEEKKNAYFELVFFECIPVDQHARLRLAEELIERYGQYMDPNDPQRRLPALMAANIEQTIKAFALHLHAMRKITQY